MTAASSSRRPIALLAAAATLASAAVSSASGCTSSYRPADATSGADADVTPPDGGVSTDDGGVDSGGSACGADLQTDAHHCGRCGHDCLGGACSAGMCQALELASAGPSAPLAFVAVSDQYVFASTFRTLAADEGGIWRAPKGGGPAELYVSLENAERTALLGDKLYFVVSDELANGGGLYSCPQVGAAPCSPTLIAPATHPRSLTIDRGRVLYGDDSTTQGLMAYAPPAAPIVFRAGFGFFIEGVVDGESAFYTVGVFPPAPPSATKVYEILPDGGVVERYTRSGTNPLATRLVGDATELFLTVEDADVAKGAVRRLPRFAGGTSCDLGGATVARPAGIHVDATRVYWANQGKGAAQPYTGGRVVSCDRASCCTTPDVMWAGNGQPTGVTGDADAIYFVTRASHSIWKIAKP